MIFYTKSNMEDGYDVTIGLEIHVQLDTDTKLFCGCSTGHGDLEPNKRVCPVCLGLPGSLPVVNEKAIEYAIEVGKALNCDITENTKFDRKNYFYPDLPKNFQITQYNKPIAREGKITFEVKGEKKNVRIRRAHLEEDPGSLVHKGTKEGKVLIDYNRSGVPLVEIVTEPDFSAPKEARKFLDKLRERLEYLDVFDPERDGALRVDVNISLSGKRAEVKNIGSVKGVEKALSYEIARQKNLIKRGSEIERETRHYDEENNITTSLREKEQEHDYRYFAEADLPNINTKSITNTVEIPELPEERRVRFIEEYGISREEAEKLTSQKSIADFYEKISKDIDPKVASTWVADELLRELNYRDMSIKEISSGDFIQLLELIQKNKLTDRSAVKALRKALDNNISPIEVVESEKLRKKGGDTIERVVSEVLEENKDAVDDYMNGENQAINYLVGQVMEKTGGSVDPSKVNETLRKEIESSAQKKGT